MEKGVYKNTSRASPASPAPDKCIKALLRRRKSVYKYLSGAEKVFSNTSKASPARRGVFKYFSGAGEILLIRNLSGAVEACEVFKNTFPAPDKYLYTLFRRWRRAYIPLFGAGEAG